VLRYYCCVSRSSTMVFECIAMVSWFLDLFGGSTSAILIQYCNSMICGISLSLNTYFPLFSISVHDKQPHLFILGKRKYSPRDPAMTASRLSLRFDRFMIFFGLPVGPLGSTIQVDIYLSINPNLVARLLQCLNEMYDLGSAF
jgi:hypothetical protein